MAAGELDNDTRYTDVSNYTQEGRPRHMVKCRWQRAPRRLPGTKEGNCFLRSMVWTALHGRRWQRTMRDLRKKEKFWSIFRETSAVSSSDPAVRDTEMSTDCEGNSIGPLPLLADGNVQYRSGASGSIWTVRLLQ